MYLHTFTFTIKRSAQTLQHTASSSITVQVRQVEVRPVCHCHTPTALGDGSSYQVTPGGDQRSGRRRAPLLKMTSPPSQTVLTDGSPRGIGAAAYRSATASPSGHFSRDRAGSGRGGNCRCVSRVSRSTCRVPRTTPTIYTTGFHRSSFDAQ